MHLVDLLIFFETLIKDDVVVTLENFLWLSKSCGTIAAKASISPLSSLTPHSSKIWFS